MSRFSAIVTAGLVVACGAWLSLSGASCRSVVAGNDKDAATELCQLLDRCYGTENADCAAFASRFGTSSVTDDHFLAFMSQNKCLDTCDAAKKCWDYPPICAASGSCTHSEQCCGFTSGLEACSGGNCCTPAGVPCDSGRRSACCGDVQCIPSPDGSLTCGGVPACLDVGTQCTFAIDCCSKSCVDGKCAQKTCSLSGEACSGGPEGPSCCSPDPGAPATSCINGTCQTSTCDGDACSAPLPCNPTGDPSSACCGNPSLHCVPDVSNTYGVCLPVQTTSQAHVPDGFDCAYDTDCCPGHVCVVAGVNKCAPAPIQCETTGSACANASNADDNACCSGQCVNQKCTCGNATCHSPREEGPPIACEPTEALADIQCTDSVCSVDPFCCCNQWDSICVAEAASSCAM